MPGDDKRRNKDGRERGYIANEQAANQTPGINEMAQALQQTIIDAEHPMEQVAANGKLLGDCNASDLEEIGEWYRQLGEAHQRCADRLSKLAT
jgi:hypothetical protein